MNENLHNHEAVKALMLLWKINMAYCPPSINPEVILDHFPGQVTKVRQYERRCRRDVSELFQSHPESTPLQPLNSASQAFFVCADARPSHVEQPVPAKYTSAHVDTASIFTLETPSNYPVSELTQVWNRQNWSISQKPFPSTIHILSAPFNQSAPPLSHIHTQTHSHASERND